MGMETKPQKLEPLNWSITSWMMNGKGGWKTQPVILVEGRKPFFADTPQEYIAELERLHDDPTIARSAPTGGGSFYTMIGQLKDALETTWNPGVLALPHLALTQEAQNGTEGTDRNGNREGR